MCGGQVSPLPTLPATRTPTTIMNDFELSRACIDARNRIRRQLAEFRAANKLPHVPVNENLEQDPICPIN